MVTITGLEKRIAVDVRPFNFLNLQRSVEILISKTTDKPYLTEGDINSLRIR